MKSISPDFCPVFSEYIPPEEKYSVLQVAVPLHFAKRLERVGKKFLFTILRFVKPFPMSGEIALDSKITSVQFPLELHQMLIKEAARLGISKNALIIMLLDEELKKRGVTLTPEDYEEIAHEMRKNKQRRNAKRSGS